MKSERKPRPRVVVLDDEPDFLLLLEAWLKPACDVTTLSHCDGFVDVVRSLRPDLVVLDVHMPERSGFDLCRLLRCEPGLESLPVVFLTGSKTDEDFLLHLETGGSRYLTKPIGRRDLLDAISEELGGPADSPAVS